MNNRQKKKYIRSILGPDIKIDKDKNGIYCINNCMVLARIVGAVKKISPKIRYRFGNADAMAIWIASAISVCKYDNAWCRHVDYDYEYPSLTATYSIDCSRKFINAQFYSFNVRIKRVLFHLYPNAVKANFFKYIKDPKEHLYRSMAMVQSIRKWTIVDHDPTNPFISILAPMFAMRKLFDYINATAFDEPTDQMLTYHAIKGNPRDNSLKNCIRCDLSDKGDCDEDHLKE